MKRGLRLEDERLDARTEFETMLNDGEVPSRMLHEYRFTEDAISSTTQGSVQQVSPQASPTEQPPAAASIPLTEQRFYDEQWTTTTSRDVPPLAANIQPHVVLTAVWYHLLSLTTTCISLLF